MRDCTRLGHCSVGLLLALGWFMSIGWSAEELDSAADYTRRAIRSISEGRLDEAVADCSEAIRMRPEFQMAYACRGAAWLKKGELDQAIADYTIAIRLSDRDAYHAFTGRGIAWRRKGQYDRAIADYYRAIRLNPVHGHEAFNALAWELATCPDDRYRNGREAVANARIACRETEWSNVFHLGTLAAAYAEAGDFVEAIRWQQAALDLHPEGPAKTAAQRRLTFYQAGQPYRDQPPAVASSTP